MRTVAIIGLGTIGSVVARLVARMPDIAQIILVDPDRYSQANLQSQDIQRSAVGELKVEVQAEAMRAINPALKIRTIAQRVENAPLATFLDSILLGCVDNRRARQTINRIAWRCGSPYIDAAVGAESVARFSTYMPGNLAPCLECTWSQSSYDLLEQAYPCIEPNDSAPASGVAAELGGLAACLQVAKLRELVSDSNSNGALAGSQFMLDASTYTAHLNRIQCNPQCRFDHQSWHIETAEISLEEHSLEDVFELHDSKSDSVLQVDSQWFSNYIDCLQCGRRRCIGLSIYARLSRKQQTCLCGGRMLATGFFSFDRLNKSQLSKTQLQRPLAAALLQPLDVLSLKDGSGRVRHFCIAEETTNE